MKDDDRTGLLLALAGFSLFPVADTITKSMAGEWSPLNVAALRFGIGALVLGAVLVGREGVGALRPRHPWLQIGRGACMAFASLLFFSAIFVMPLADAIALAFVSPVFTALLAGWLLQEKVRWSVWIASAIALTGVAIVLQPNLLALGWVAVLPLGSAFFFALMTVLNRASIGGGSPLAMQAYIAAAAMPFLLLAVFAGKFAGLPGHELTAPDWTVVLRCAAVAVIASSAHWLAYLGTMKAGASAVAPVIYVEIIVASVLGWIIFGDVPTPTTLLGAVIIVAAGVILWRFTPARGRTGN